MAENDTDDTVGAVRSFNRFHTRFAGLLAPTYLDSGLTLAEARLLYEIVQEDGVLASALQKRLGLDAGYASRMLRRFEAKGWIERGRGRDARQRPIAVTAAGRAVFDALEARTRCDLQSRLDRLDADGRRTLAGALGTARILLGDPDAPAWSMRTFEAGDMGMIAARQAILYARHHGWGVGMEVLLGEVTTGFLRDFKPGREQCWVAERGGRMVGSILVCDSGNDAAQLRLLYVESDARGLGIGEALVSKAVGFAREAGYDRIWLWTHSDLASARRIYAGCGFICIAVEMHETFGTPESGETWELRFRD